MVLYVIGSCSHDAVAGRRNTTNLTCRSIAGFHSATRFVSSLCIYAYLSNESLL